MPFQKGCAKPPGSGRKKGNGSEARVSRAMKQEAAYRASQRLIGAVTTDNTWDKYGDNVLIPVGTKLTTEILSVLPMEVLLFIPVDADLEIEVSGIIYKALENK